MSKKFLVLGFFLVAGFLFFHAPSAQAVAYSWTGGGDGATWTDPKNWGGDGTVINAYPGGAYDSASVTIDGTASTSVGHIQTVVATSTVPSGITTLTITNGFTLVIGNGATLLASSTVAVTGTSTLKMGNSTWGSGTLQLNMSGTNNQPLVIESGAAFTAGATATGTVMYAGTGGVNIASTTYYNLLLAPTSTASFYAGSSTATGNFGVSNVLTVGPGATLNGNGSTITLSGSGTPWVKTGGTASFTANGSSVVYNSASATNIATGTYSTLSITGAATKTLVGNTSINATGTVTILSGATLAIGTYTFTATGGTWTNGGTVTEGTGGKITKASSSQFTNSSGTAKTSYDATTEGVYVTVTDTSLNFNASTAETQTVTISTASGFNDSKSVTLTETGVATGIFRGGINFMFSGSSNSGVLAYIGPGTVSFSYTDSQDTSDTGSGSVSFTGTSGGGGGGGGGAAATTATTQTTTTTTAAPTTATTTTTTATVPTTTAVPTVAVSGPTLESVQTKVASAIAKVAALPKNPTASDLASIQAEIAAILSDIQSIQAAQPTPQGVALGFNFVRPLALGMRNSDVTNLQNALKTDSSIYPEGKVTGYFGPATLKAVQKFQEKYGIASSGSAGYGKVGPATRAKLNALYGAK